MTFIIDSLDGLKEVARAVIEASRGRRIVALRGEMGAGKTTLVSAIAEQLGVEDVVSSPTFALVNNYLTADGETIYHFDFYRIDNLREAYDLGYEEYFDSGALCLIEWAERIEPLLPPDTLNVYIEVVSPTERKITIT